MAKIMIEPDFPRNEYEQRFKKAKRQMEKKNIDAMLITEEVNLTYFAGFRKIMPYGTKTRTYLLHFCLLPRDSAPVLIIPQMMRGNAESMSWIGDVRFFRAGYARLPDVDPIELLASVIREKGLADGTLGMELGANMRLDASINDYLDLRNKLPNMKVADTSNSIWELRTTKSPAEIAYLQEACDIAQRAVEAGFQSMRVGMAEAELLKEMYKGALDAGGADVPLKLFFVIRSGPDRYPMGDTRPSSRKKLKKGDMVLIDGGVGFKGYMSDLIRQASIGTPGPQQKRMYDLAVESQSIALENIKAGADVADVSRKALEVFDRAGYAEGSLYMGIGHGIGLEIHEPPFLSTASRTTLKTGNTLCVEPIMYDPVSARYVCEGVLEGDGEGVFVVEDDIVVMDRGIKNMTPMSKELYVVKT